MIKGRGTHFFPGPFFPHLMKICRYCISGGTGALIDFGVYSALIYFFSTNYLVSNLISFSCGTVVTYYLQKNWTFQYKTTKNIAVFQRYIVAVLLTYTLNNFLLFAFVGILILNVFLAKILQIVLSTFFAYTINSRYVFRQNTVAPAQE